MISHNFIQRHLLRRSALSDILSPLGALNAACQRRRRQRKTGLAWHPSCKVVSIGNLTSGGSGKTPFSVYLAELLAAGGIRIAVSHRGYKGALENTPSLISNGQRILYGVRDCGDEAFLLANRLPQIPVVVGRERRAAVSLLLAEFPKLQAVVLDDAFQHLKIARDLDIVCFDAETGIGNGRMLPAGYLREPLDSLKPPTVAMIIHKEPAAATGSLEALLVERKLPVFHCYYGIEGIVGCDGTVADSDNMKGKKVILASGIANPGSFERTVTGLGVKWLHHFRYPDHYAFMDEREANRIADLCEKYQADALLCTEKDLAKLCLHPLLRDKTLAVRIGLNCPDHDKLRDLVLERLGFSSLPHPRS